MIINDTEISFIEINFAYSTNRRLNIYHFSKLDGYENDPLIKNYTTLTMFFFIKKKLKNVFAI